MLSLLKKLFAKKTEVSEAPWPFPTGPVITKQEPWPESTQTVSVTEPVVTPVAKPKKVSKPKSAPRKPRAKKSQ
jgi:hypothetical protein